MRVFVGLGEGIGNVVMGLPLLDAVGLAGHEVDVHIRSTPPGIREDLERLILHERPGVRLAMESMTQSDGSPYDAACLTWWWIQRGGPLPSARETFVGRPPSDDPEILANLAAARELLPGAAPSARAVLFAPRLSFVLPISDDARPLVLIHPGCKDDPEWKRRKVYPRWAEVTHRAKDRGAQVVIVGTAADDAYCGEPNDDLRGKTETLLELASLLRYEPPGGSVLVSGDSGIHHMAVALDLPTVVLFGGGSSVGKATHPDPAVPPVVLAGPAFDGIDPRAVADSAVLAAQRTHTHRGILG